MPIAPLALAPLLSHVFSLIIYGSAIGGSIIGYCNNHPGPGCIKRRDIEVLGLAGAQGAHVKRADVGPCNVPMYNFDICRDQIRNQGVQIWSSIPNPGGAYYSLTQPPYTPFPSQTTSPQRFLTLFQLPNSTTSRPRA